MVRRKGFYIERLLATGLSFILFGIGGMILGFMVFPLILLTSGSKSRGQRRCRAIVRACFRLFIGMMRALGVLTYSIEGQEYLDHPGELVIANHPSLIDIVFLISVLPDAKCIVKSELLKNPVMWGPVTCTGYIPNVDAEQLLRDCVDSLQSGSSLVIFPEGSRTVSGHPLRFKRGGAHIAINSGCPIRLVHIKSEPPILGKHEKWYHIPSRRPHFTLTVQQHSSAAPTVTTMSKPQAARELTLSWQSFFTQELNI